MSSEADIAKLRQILDIKYRRERESFGRLIAEETRLRAALRQLAQQMTTSQDATDPHQRAIGADIAWQGWIGRKQRELNLQLARVLSVKEQHIAQVRIAFGKSLVADALLEQLARENAARLAETQMEKAINAALF